MKALARKGRRLWRSNGRFMQVTRFILFLLFSRRTLIFRPNRSDWGTPADRGLAFEEVSLVAGRETLRAWWLPHRTPEAAVLLFPGRGANISHEIDTLEYLSALGVSVIAVDYPGFGGSTGVPSEAGCYAAAEAAWQFVTSKGFSSSNVILYGRSLGGAVASWLAARVRCRALVFHGGFSSLEDLARHYLPRWLSAARSSVALDSVRYVRESRCPLLLLHAHNDALVPIELARRVFDAANPPKTMIELSDDHFGTHWLRRPDVRSQWQSLISGAAR